MPRITEERREARREQVLEAVRACLQEQGLEALSMEAIIARSGLSTGAVYGYFKGKDEVVNAAITEGTAELGGLLAPILDDPEPPPLPELFARVLKAIVDFGRHKPGNIDRLLVAIHGWSHSQSSPELKTSTRAAYRRLRGLFEESVRRGQATGSFPPGADAEGVAELMTSLCLGFVAQRTLAGEASIAAHVAAMDALIGPSSPSK